MNNKLIYNFKKCSIMWCVGDNIGQEMEAVIDGVGDYEGCSQG
jgi:hypothetical protein